MKINKLDTISLASIAVAIIGFIFVAVGLSVLSVHEGIGVNTNIHPLAIVGIVFIVIALATSIIGNANYEKWSLNRIFADISLYLAIIALMITIIYLFITIAGPVLNPSSG